MVDSLGLQAADGQILYGCLLLGCLCRGGGFVIFVFYSNDPVFPEIEFFQVFKSFDKGCLFEAVLCIDDLDALLFWLVF